MLRWVILSVVVVMLAAAATFLVQSGSYSTPTWDLPARIRQGGAAAEGRGRGPAHPRIRDDGDPEDRHEELEGQEQGRGGPGTVHDLVHMHVHDRQVQRRLEGGRQAGREHRDRPRVEDEQCGRRLLQGGDDRHQRPGPSGVQARGPRHGARPDRDRAPRSRRGCCPSARSPTTRPRRPRSPSSRRSKPDFKLTKISTSKPDLIVVKPIPLKPEEVGPAQDQAGDTGSTSRSSRACPRGISGKS